MREILTGTGRGIYLTDLMPEEITEVRSSRIESVVERVVFMDTFNQLRSIIPHLVSRPMDLEFICVELTRHSHVMYAAMVEALASIRAEGTAV